MSGLSKSLIGLVVGVAWLTVVYTLDLGWTAYVPGGLLVCICLIAGAVWTSDADRSGLGKLGDGSGSG